MRFLPVYDLLESRRLHSCPALSVRRLDNRKAWRAALSSAGSQASLDELELNAPVKCKRAPPWPMAVPEEQTSPHGWHWLRRRVLRPDALRLPEKRELWSLVHWLPTPENVTRPGPRPRAPSWW